jgi:hypothetical protein
MREPVLPSILFAQQGAAHDADERCDSPPATVANGIACRATGHGAQHSTCAAFALWHRHLLLRTHLARHADLLMTGVLEMTRPSSWACDGNAAMASTKRLALWSGVIVRIVDLHLSGVYSPMLGIWSVNFNFGSVKPL